jgi:hypothetical protein
MPEELSIEERAAIMGHVPLEDFKGNPDKWIPPEKYIERAENLLPISKAAVNKLTKDIAEIKHSFEEERSSLTQEIAGLKKTLGDFAEFSKGAEERAFKKALVELETKQRQAVADGDVEAFDQVRTELDELKKHPAATGHPVVETAAAVEVKKSWPEVSDPVVYKEWADENDWVSDVDMAIYARQVDLHLQNTTRFSTQREQLDKITELVKKKFPQHWANSNTDKGKPQVVEGGSDGASNASGRGKKTYADLPAAAKQYCDEWAGKDGKGTSGSIPGFTRQQYVDQYQWD